MIRGLRAWNCGDWTLRCRFAISSLGGRQILQRRDLLRGVRSNLIQCQYHRRQPWCLAEGPIRHEDLRLSLLY